MDTKVGDQFEFSQIGNGGGVSKNLNEEYDGHERKWPRDSNSRPSGS